MLRRFHKSLDIWDEPLLFSITAVTAFFFFRLAFFWSVLVPKGDCLYTFWNPVPGAYFSPFWITVAIALCLLAWALSGLARSVKSQAKHWTLAGFYILAALAAGGWLHGMTGLWDAMRYERGEISSTEFYGVVPRLSFNEPHRCRGI